MNIFMPSSAIKHIEPVCVSLCVSVRVWHCVCLCYRRARLSPWYRCPRSSVKPTPEGSVARPRRPKTRLPKRQTQVHTHPGLLFTFYSCTGHSTGMDCIVTPFFIIYLLFTQLYSNFRTIFLSYLLKFCWDPSSTQYIECSENGMEAWREDRDFFSWIPSKI